MSSGRQHAWYNVITRALAVWLTFAMTGCAVPLGAGPSARAPANAIAFTPSINKCARVALGVESPYRVPLPQPVHDEKSLAVLALVPHEVRRTMQAAGIEALVVKVLAERAARSRGTTTELLALQERLGMHMRALEAQLASILYEIDCTGDEVEGFLHDLEHREHRKELALTIASLSVAGAAAVTAGALALSEHHPRAEAIVGLSGGVASAGLGVSAFAHRSPTIAFRHERNLLAPLAGGEDAEHMFPSFVFRLLSSHVEGAGTAPAASLVQRYRALLVRDFGPQEGALRTAVVFGGGGIYDKSLLGTRQDILDDLEALLGGFRRDVEVLERYLLQLFGPEQEALEREGSQTGERE
jgi:hypothetical protein